MSIIDCNYSVTGSGPAIFLTHGVGGAEDAWRFITPKLKSMFTVVTYDLRGHGKSPVDNKDFNLNDLVLDLERIRENPNLTEDTQVAIKLPRLSFEITSISYDAQRQLAKVGNFTTNASTGENTKRQRFFNPVPYSINFQLNAYAKSQDDALQIVEQILPTFNPQYALTIKPFPSEYPGFKEDIQVIIQGVSFSDDFEGALEQRRTIIYSMDFEMKLSYHGPITDTSIIRDVRAKVFDIKAGLNLSLIHISEPTRPY